MNFLQKCRIKLCGLTQTPVVVPKGIKHNGIRSANDRVAVVYAYRIRPLRGEIIRRNAGVYTYRIDAQFDEIRYSGERYIYWTPVAGKNISLYDTPRKALEEIYRLFKEL